MGNTRTLVKTLSTGIPALGDLVDGEIVVVEDSEVWYQRVDATTLISNISLTDAGVDAVPSVAANTAKVGVTKTSVESVLVGEITTHTHPTDYDNGIGTSDANNAANALGSGNADTIIESGLYALGGSVTNKPVAGGGHFIVNNNQSASNDDYLSQTFIPYAGNEIYFRTKNGGSYGSWKKLQPYISYTVSTLPTGAQGDVAYVTDALTPSYLSTVVGGGAVVCPVWYDGTNWICR